MITGASSGIGRSAAALFGKHGWRIGLIARSAENLEATRREPGNKWFEKSRSVDDPDIIVTIEAFDDEAAGEAHVASQHFQESMEGPSTRHMVEGVPDILYIKLPDKDGWDKMAEFLE